MIVRTVALASIDVGGRLRALDPAWVDLLAEEIQRDGQIEPIRVVERGERFVLIDGARRFAACAKLGHTGIEAKIEPEEALADAAFVRLGEIKGNFLRGELTMLERAYYVAAWREVYESVNALPRRGRKPKTEMRVQRTNISGEAANDDAADAFVLSLSDAAQRALQISQKTLYRYLQIATIPPEQGHRLTGHPSADSRVELLILAEQPMVRQAQIVELMLDGDPRFGTVAEAIAHLDGAAPAPKLSPPERFHQTFSRLRPQDQEVFFDLNLDAIERWQAARSAKGCKVGRRGVA
ncbi:ParB N-terminal domain-containing protein [Methylobacterium iners]|uniref:Nucleoid occlusion protein n=1 Tax=Methylobacterium iners TaxID=418707 RepID=A0ABQ4S4B7_9HYPH|nr:ParB N-terminal domain-containing protein [Methylobacterium iners]GJD97756.1 Nucleoid occlusion protein [Methylobacterium iners]